jgi:hypothetical protein
MINEDKSQLNDKIICIVICIISLLATFGITLIITLTINIIFPNDIEISLLYLYVILCEIAFLLFLILIKYCYNYYQRLSIVAPSPLVEELI